LPERSANQAPFFKNVLILFGASALAQALQLAASPVLTRLYTPRDFGLFALFVAVLSLFANIANGRFELAVMLPRHHKEAMAVASLGLVCNILLSGVLFVSALLFGDDLARWLGWERLWVVMLPVGVFFIGFFMLLGYLANRFGEYAAIARANVLRSLVAVVTQLLFFKWGATGLNAGPVAGYGVAANHLLHRLAARGLMFRFGSRRLGAMLKKYKKFLLATVPHTFLATAAQHFPVFVLADVGMVKAGYYALVMRAVAVPMQTVAGSYNQVFFAAFAKSSQKYAFFLRKFLAFNAFAIPLLLVLAPFLDDLFALLFGSEWQTAGEYAQILLPWIYARFVTDIFATPIYLYYQRQWENLLLEVVYIAALLVAWAGGQGDSTAFLRLLAAFGSGVLLLKLIRSVIILTKEENGRR